MRNVLTVGDLTGSEIRHIFALADDLKKKWCDGIRESVLPGRVIALLFRDRSLRSRLAFESAMIQMGGRSIVLGSDVGFGTRESTADFCRVLSQFSDAVVVRSPKHSAVVDVASNCSCSVINGRTDAAFPCQAMADLFTLREAVGSLESRTFVFVGERGPMARSLAEGCVKVGMRFIMAAPVAYQLDQEFATDLCRAWPQAQFEMTTDARAAVRQASIVYGGGWSLVDDRAIGDHSPADLSSFRLTTDLLRCAPKNVFRMHNLQTDRRIAVAEEVFNHPKGLISKQLSNRLHFVKGLLLWLLGAQDGRRNLNRGSQHDLCVDLLIPPAHIMRG